MIIESQSSACSRKCTIIIETKHRPSTNSPTRPRRDLGMQSWTSRSRIRKKTNKCNKLVSDNVCPRERPPNWMPSRNSTNRVIYVVYRPVNPRAIRRRPTPLAAGAQSDSYPASTTVARYQPDRMAKYPVFSVAPMVSGLQEMAKSSPH